MDFVYMTSTGRPLVSLLLAGDGDDCELLTSLEEAFGVRFDDHETLNWHTVGDLYDGLIERFPVETASGKCPTAMAFYAVRRYLRHLGAKNHIAPTTKLSQLTRKSRSQFLANMAQYTGTRPLPGAYDELTLGISLVAIACAALSVAPSTILALGLIITVYAGAAITRARLAGFSDTTVGELSLELASHNLRHFADLGADRREPTVWTVFKRLLADFQAVDPDRIEKTTRLLA